MHAAEDRAEAPIVAEGRGQCTMVLVQAFVAAARRINEVVAARNDPLDKTQQVFVMTRLDDWGPTPRVNGAVNLSTFPGCE